MNALALRQYLNTQANLTNKLGVTDCVTFVTNAVFAGWNRDYRGMLDYSDRKTAVAQLRRMGGLKGACMKAMGGMYSIADLEPGDVVWYNRPPCIGLLMQGYIMVKQAHTIHRVEIENHLMGWKTIKDSDSGS